MIIDAHSHYIPAEIAQNTTFFKQFWSDTGAHLRLMDEYRIDAAVLLYPTTDAHLQMGGWSNVCAIYNQRIAEVVKDGNGRFIGAGIIPVDKPEAIPVELDRIRSLGLKMLSLASSYEGKYLDNIIFEPVFEFAAKHRMPIHVHAQIMDPIGMDRVNDPLLTPVLEYVADVSMCIGKMMMSGVFLKYPQIDFIFAHYGGVLPLVKERFDSTYSMLRGRNLVKDITKQPSEFFKNLYFDMSGSRSAASLSVALEMTDAEHICWGSDFPANKNFAGSLAVISSQILSTENRVRISGANISNLFNK